MKMSYQYISGLMFNKLLLGAVVISILASCTKDPNSPGVEYMPDMYRSPSYEPYIKVYELDSVKFFERNFERLGIELETLDSISKKSAIADVQALWDVFKSGNMTKKPVEGTVASGKMPFGVSKDDRSAAASVKMPLAYSEASIKEGKVYYEMFCDHCHGEKGQGDGPMVKLEVYPVPPPAYNSVNSKGLSAGEIYHTIYYGKGMMGSHASQISEDKRWKIVQYVQTLQGKKLEELVNGKVEMPAPAVVDSAVAVEPTDSIK